MNNILKLALTLNLLALALPGQTLSDRTALATNPSFQLRVRAAVVQTAIDTVNAYTTAPPQTITTGTAPNTVTSINPDWQKWTLAFRILENGGVGWETRFTGWVVSALAAAVKSSGETSGTDTAIRVATDYWFSKLALTVQ